MTPLLGEDRWDVGRRREREGERVMENTEVKATNNKLALYTRVNGYNLA